MNKNRLVAIGLSLASIVALGPLALAHAVLTKSNPQPNSAVSGPEMNASLTFNSRVDLLRSSLSLLKPDGKIDTLKIEDHSPPGVVAAKITGLTKGSYVLQWQALSADGHIT